MEPQRSKDELNGLTRRMKNVADEAYWLFFRAGMGAEAHAFIEWCGVLNKYVEICCRCAELGIDFTASNVHSGQALPVEEHDMEYLGEKRFGREQEYWHVRAHPEKLPGWWINIGHPKRSTALRMAYAALKAVAEAAR